MDSSLFITPTPTKETSLQSVHFVSYTYGEGVGVGVGVGEGAGSGLGVSTISGVGVEIFKRLGVKEVLVTFVNDVFVVLGGMGNMALAMTIQMSATGRITKVPPVITELINSESRLYLKKSMKILRTLNGQSRKWLYRVRVNEYRLARRKPETATGREETMRAI